MKYDCSKTLDFFHERNRMCNSYVECLDGCPLEGKFCYSTKHLTQEHIQEHIDIVQKWSDEHPEKTREEVFLEIFPKLKALKDKVVNFDSNCLPCFYELIGKCEGDYCGEKTCSECWQESYNGEFEKARRMNKWLY